MLTKRLCTRCHRQGVPKRKTSGSFVVELFVWGMAVVGFLFFILPGLLIGAVALIYSLWRITSRTRVCRSCGSEELVPLGSPRAEAIAGATQPVSEGARESEEYSGEERWTSVPVTELARRRVGPGVPVGVLALAGAVVAVLVLYYLT